MGELVNFLDTQRKPLEESKRKKGPYPYYGASGIVDYVSDYIFDRELILLSEDGANITDRNYPVCFLASGKYWVNNHAHVLECKAENDNNFICISLERKDFKKFNTGMAMPKLNKETCKIIPVSCTSLEEQTKIGNFFRELETNITLHQRKPKLLCSSQNFYLVSEYAHPWEQRKLKEITSRVQGNDGRVNLQTLTISAGNGWMKQEDRFSANIAGKEQKNYTLLKKGELAYNHGNSKLAKFGAVFELKDFDEALVPRVYHSFRVNNKTNSSFIEYMFATKLPDKELGKLVSSGARMDGLLNIGYEDFVGINITVPSLEEQQKIAYHFRKLDEVITLHQR